jgi:hypothetical protein
MKRDAVTPILVALFVFGYPLSYTVLRATHLLTHTAFFISSEGLDAHHIHGMDGNDSLQTIFRPLIELELKLQRYNKP